MRGARKKEERKSRWIKDKGQRQREGNGWIAILSVNKLLFVFFRLSFGIARSFKFYTQLTLKNPLFCCLLVIKKGRSLLCWTCLGHIIKVSSSFHERTSGSRHFFFQFIMQQLQQQLGIFKLMFELKGEIKAATNSLGRTSLHSRQRWINISLEE